VYSKLSKSKGNALAFAPLAMARGIATALAVVLLAPAAGAQTGQDPPAAVASIDVSRNANGLVVGGSVLALTDGSYQAVMDINRRSSGGTSTTSQGGMVHLKAGQRDTIATSGVSFQPGDAIDISLVVTSGGHDLSTAHVTVK
jgi:hypothetical protein